MELCKTLEGYGFDLRLVRDGEIERVEARRTDKTQLAVKVSGPLLLQLSRAQDEAIAFVKRRQFDVELDQRVKACQALHQRIMSDPLDPQDASIAAAICEYNILLGHEMASDGLKWTDVIKNLQQR